MSNVVQFPTSHKPPFARIVRAITLDEFVAADEAGKWSDRVRVNGLTILQCPIGMLICDSDARCTAVVYSNANIEKQLEAALDAIA